MIRIPILSCFPPLRLAALAILLAVALLAALRPALAQELIGPEQAFRVEARMSGPQTLSVSWRIAAGHYMYRHAFAVRAPAGGVVLGEPDIPDGQRIEDEFFGEVMTYDSDLTFTVPVTPIANGLDSFTLEVAGQGCNEPVGVCYPPMTRRLEIPLSTAAAAPMSRLAAADASPGSVNPPAAADAAPGPANPAAAIGAQSVFWALLLALGSGLLLTFTPCVLPMVPILAGIIVGQGERVTRLRGGGLAVVYVLGTAVTYTAMGVVAGLTGDQLQAWFQNIWTIGFVAVLLGLMALSMFGLYELRMPSVVQTRVQRHAAAQRAGAFGGVFVMGVLSALIVGACVSPILISVLGLAISRGDPLLGGALMFAMAVGMGVLLVAMGLGFGHLLPRAGAWMIRIQHLFGFMLLGVAVYILGAIPALPVLYLWAALALAAALYLGVYGSARAAVSGRLLRQILAAGLVAWGVLAVLGGMQGSRDVLAPLNYQALGDGSRAAPAAKGVQFRRVANRAELRRLMAAAAARQQPVMVDYYADWCVDCIRMEQSTFREARVAQVLNEQFTLLQVDVTDPGDPGTRAIRQSHDVYGPPAMLFFDRQGRELTDMRRYGYLDGDAFLRHIEPLLDG